MRRALVALATLATLSPWDAPPALAQSPDELTAIHRFYITTGKVKYVARDFPLESIHPQALKAAEATHCPEEQDKYWEMRARLFANQRALGPGDLPQHAGALGLEPAAFQQCLDSGNYASKIRQDLADGKKAGVNATPSFFLGLTEPTDPKVKVLRMLKGAQPYPAFKDAIDSLLFSPRPWCGDAASGVIG